MRGTYLDVRSIRQVGDIVEFQRCLGPRLGSELDLLVEQPERLVPIEAMASATPRRQWRRALPPARDLGARAARGYVIHGGDVELPLGPDTTAWPLSRP